MITRMTLVATLQVRGARVAEAHTVPRLARRTLISNGGAPNTGDRRSASAKSPSGVVGGGDRPSAWPRLRAGTPYVSNLPRRDNQLPTVFRYVPRRVAGRQLAVSRIAMLAAKLGATPREP